jgi:hypothetical protein
MSTLSSKTLLETMNQVTRETVEKVHKVFESDTTDALCICRPVGCGDGNTVVVNPRCKAHDTKRAAVEPSTIQFKDCGFFGDPPAPFTDWNSWAAVIPHTGVQIRALGTTIPPKTVTCECGALVADINQHACAFRPKNVRCECPAPGTSNSTVSPFCPMHADSAQPPTKELNERDTSRCIFCGCKECECPGPFSETKEYREIVLRAPVPPSASLEAALNPRLWTKEQSDAWHQHISIYMPDVQAGFDALRATVTKSAESP